MKTRMGFVSNSSSSSFIVTIKSKESQEDLNKYNNKFLKKQYGDVEDYGGIYPFVPEPGHKILTFNSVEYGAEKSVENIVLDVLKGLNFNTEDIIITIGE